MLKPSWHLVPIPKGVTGEFSKVEEEFAEWKDARSQNNIPLELWEIADTLLAIKQYLQETHNLTLRDILIHVDKIESMHRARNLGSAMNSMGDIPPEVQKLVMEEMDKVIIKCGPNPTVFK